MNERLLAVWTLFKVNPLYPKPILVQHAFLHFNEQKRGTKITLYVSAIGFTVLILVCFLHLVGALPVVGIDVNPVILLWEGDYPGCVVDDDFNKERLSTARDAFKVLTNIPDLVQVLSILVRLFFFHAFVWNVGVGVRVSLSSQADCESGWLQRSLVDVDSSSPHFLEIIIAKKMASILQDSESGFIVGYSAFLWTLNGDHQRGNQTPASHSMTHEIRAGKRASRKSNRSAVQAYLELSFISRATFLVPRTCSIHRFCRLLSTDSSKRHRDLCALSGTFGIAIRVATQGKRG
ncbi:hypothetical protein HYFRA_00005765 [Hymenoscyphus fraxineus]|uniref:Uncharacterized protein n=1 Tax=Hymenoscyphus fraxineus TaxID=746836 RepID=A0A9N9KSN1_9HELO|nr:hypothetical protein HYFRA_00005765 [Hymenoscyphus fraxineus]